ncbi:hypothetical protein [Ichthyenterobacterium magnum]|uniref:Uncharacterized protein n=1 Tax=Ichthyenterobacterium magnum TaxID=1230530 RepID=A0A420DWD1_9FLAO|nr:hypothetical protein [Ichthyenterobacterium magnum]RKE98525.1 hypothetical protein BXY80_0614 [Ichthyenterobacterium magnum]
MNWIKFLNYSKLIAIITFAILYLGKRLALFEDYQITESISLFDFNLVLVLLYFVLYLKESRLELKQKIEEIEDLKSQLKTNS